MNQKQLCEVLVIGIKLYLEENRLLRWVFKKKYTKFKPRLMPEVL